MKNSLLKKLCAFIIEIIMFSMITESANAQAKTGNKSLTGYLCSCGFRNYGCTITYTKRKDIRNCIRSCSPVCTFFASVKIASANKTSLINIYNNPVLNTASIYELAWKAIDENGDTANTGIYLLQDNEGNYVETN